MYFNASVFKTVVVPIIIVLLAVLAVIIWRGDDSTANASELDQFAQCLTERGAIMYGAYWCSHCQNEKKAFGKSFRYVTYVECTEEPKRCTDAGINGFPTWMFPDGRRFEGEQGIEKLSRESGCVVPSGTNK